MTVILYSLGENNQTLKKIIENEYEIYICDYQYEITKLLNTTKESTYVVVTTARGKKEAEKYLNPDVLYICLDKLCNLNKSLLFGFFDIIIDIHDKTGVLDKLEKAFYHLEYKKSHTSYLLEDKKNRIDPLTKLYTKAFMDHFLETQKKLMDKSLLVLINLEGIELLNKIYGEKTAIKALISISDQLKELFPDLVLSRYYKYELIGTVMSKDFHLIEPVLSIFNEQNIKIKDIPLPIGINISYEHYEPKTVCYKEVIKKIRQIAVESKRSQLIKNKTQYLTKLQVTLEESNEESKEHLINLQILTLDFINKLKLTELERKNLLDAVMLHDIGKLGISQSILDKPTKLTEEEYEEIKKHPEYGYHIALFEGFSVRVAKAILHHHERFDGNGYPKKLVGKNIPLLSRIIAILDAFEVMTRGRIYKPAISKNEAIDELIRCKGTQFDPELVDKFVCLINLKK